MRFGSPLDFGAYSSRNMAVYVALSVPAIVIEILLSLSIASSPSLAGVPFSVLVQLLPWVVTAGSVFAILTFRSSLLLTLLVLGYFVSAVVSQSTSVAVAGATLDPSAGAALVVVSVFLALMAFGFARSAKIQSGKKADLVSRGSLPFQVVGFSLDFGVPAALAVMLVLVTTGIFGVVKGSLQSLPPPLSGIFASGLGSPFAAVFVTLVIAGVTLWTFRELVEPVVMYYSITREDAVKLLQEDLAIVAKPLERSLKRDLRGGAFTVLVIVGILALAYVEFGPSALASQLPAAFGAGRPASYPSFTVQTNNMFNELERLIESIIRLLWG